MKKQDLEDKYTKNLENIIDNQRVKILELEEMIVELKNQKTALSKMIDIQESLIEIYQKRR